MGLDMFSSYDNLSNDYIPNNMPNRSANSKECYRPPFSKNCNSKQSYYWYYGDSVNLSFIITGEILVASDSYIYSITGDLPNNTTFGRVYQKAYNITDFKSWTCTLVSDDQYSWVEDLEFTYPPHGAKNVYMSVLDYLVGKTIYVKLFNFRDDEIDSRSFDGSLTISYLIDEEQSNKLNRGTYYLDLILYDPLSNLTTMVMDHVELTVI